MKWFLIFLISLGPLYSESFSVKHARTAEDRLQGLMGVKSLPIDEGVLFHFPEEGKYPFWGWGCYLDLGIAYLDERGKVLEIAHLETYPTDHPPNFSNKEALIWLKKSYSPQSPAFYVLEMQWTWFERTLLSVGDEIQIDKASTIQKIFKSNKMK